MFFLEGELHTDRLLKYILLRGHRHVMALCFKLYKYAAEKSSFEMTPHLPNQSSRCYIITTGISSKPRIPTMLLIQYVSRKIAVTVNFHPLEDPAKKENQ